jgi:hypothetical protein
VCLSHTLEIFTKNVVFWAVGPCGACKNRRFGEKQGLHHQGNIRSVRRLLVIANVVPNSPILASLLMEALRSSETTVLTTATRRNIPEDGIFHSHRRENLKSYVALTGWAL